MNAERSFARTVARFLILLLVALVLQRLSPAEAGGRPPKAFPRAALVTGTPLEGEGRGKGVLLDAGWIDSDGNPQRWFRRERLFPWPKPLTMAASTFRIRLDGVRYPGRLEVGVFRRTGLNDSPSGGRTIYICETVPTPEARCRWVPSIEEGRLVWDVEIDHEQAQGHLYVVAVGTWDEPQDPPRPVGARQQIGTWIFHGRLERL